MFQDFPIGPAALFFDGTEVGLMQGGCTVSIDEETVKTYADKTGKVARFKVSVGRLVMVKGAITEATLAQIAAITGGTVTAGSTIDELVLHSGVGTDLTALARESILKPIINNVVSADPADFIYIPKMSLSAKFELAYNFDGQRVFGFEGEGHPVLAADIADGGFLYNSGSPDYAEGDLIRFGQAD